MLYWSSWLFVIALPSKRSSHSLWLPFCCYEFSGIVILSMLNSTSCFSPFLPARHRHCSLVFHSLVGSPSTLIAMHACSRPCSRASQLLQPSFFYHKQNLRYVLYSHLINSRTLSVLPWCECLKSWAAMARFPCSNLFCRTTIPKGLQCPA